ncbi:biotin/lipoyl-containing protein [Corynebacterium sp.]
MGTIEAMKMEAPITAHATGVVRRLLIQGPRQVEAGDLLLVVDQS